MSGTVDDADEIRDEIDLTRKDLAQAVDALSAKLDVRAQAKAKVDDLKASAAEAGQRAKQATSPEVQAALDNARSTLAPVAAKVDPYRRQALLIALGATTVLLVVIRRRSSR